MLCFLHIRFYKVQVTYFLVMNILHGVATMHVVALILFENTLVMTELRTERLSIETSTAGENNFDTHRTARVACTVAVL
jgi:hypothetical protein